MQRRVSAHEARQDLKGGSVVGEEGLEWNIVFLVECGIARTLIRVVVEWL